MAFIIEAGSHDEVLHIASMHPAPRRAKRRMGRRAYPRECLPGPMRVWAPDSSMP